MDRRPDPTDELYDFAREAYACADYDQAVYFLRKASSLAPMRQDIRQFLAEVLSRSGSDGPVASETNGKPAPFQSIAVEALQQVGPQEEYSSQLAAPARTVSTFFQQPLRRLMERLPVKPFFAAAEEEDDNPPLSLPEPARIEPVPVAPTAIIIESRSTPRPDSLDALREPVSRDESPRRSLSRSEPKSEFAPTRRSELNGFPSPDESGVSFPIKDTTGVTTSGWAELSEVETPPVVDPPAKRTRTKPSKPVQLTPPTSPEVSPTEPPELPEESVETPVTAADWLASLPAPSRRLLVFASAYALVGLFVALACTRCYSSFFRVQPVVQNGLSAAPLRNGPSTAPPQGTGPTAPAPVSLQSPAAIPVQPPTQEYATLVRAALQDGRHDEAAALLNNHASGMGSEQKSLLAELATALDREGTEHLGQRHYKAAIDSYSKAFGFASSNAAFAVHLGNAYYYAATRGGEEKLGQEQLQNAIEVLQRALELDSESIEAYHRLATVYQKLGKNADAVASWNKALAVLNRSLKTNGKKIETYQRIALIGECLGRKSEQREAYKAILGLAKSGSPAFTEAEKELKALGKTN